MVYKKENLNIYNYILNQKPFMTIPNLRTGDVPCSNDAVATSCEP